MGLDPEDQNLYFLLDQVRGLLQNLYFLLNQVRGLLHPFLKGNLNKLDPLSRPSIP